MDLGQALAALPAHEPAPNRLDWLVHDIDTRATVSRAKGAQAPGLVLSNGLLRRVFRLAPDAATIAFDNLRTDTGLLRAVSPEARITLDGQAYDVGGLLGQPEFAYLRPEWLPDMTAAPAAFHCTGFDHGPTQAPFAWKRKRYSAGGAWPAPGVRLTLHFESPSTGPHGLALDVVYELYDGIPVLCKWLELRNGGSTPVRVDSFSAEVLALVDHETSVGEPNHWSYPLLHVESDYAFHGMGPADADVTTCWLADPRYTSQVNYLLAAPLLLETRPPIGPGMDLAPGQAFPSFRSFIVSLDSTDRERRGLSLRRFYRTLAPWVTENPILMHVRHADGDAVRAAIDQCADVGFEMVIMTFGSGFDAETEDPEVIATMRALADYAHSRGIELGGYSLLASRTVSPTEDVIDPATGEPGHAKFGNSPCLGGNWGQQYLRRIQAFYEQTGLDILEHDGSYPGDICASTSHPGHRDLADSQWSQWQAITALYHWCRGQGIYLNVPDWYFLNGSNKTGMGYRETNWSLPRDRQILLGRQNIYDGTWEKSPSMGWMFVPLVEYQGGGEAATLEPLSEHLGDYAAHLAQNFSAGVQACYRGPRLFDSEATRAVVARWVAFYKEHRDILDSDVIHVRRPDARGIDCLLHVNPRLPIRGLAVVHNPLDEPVYQRLRLPLYYTGIERVARVRERVGDAACHWLTRDHTITVNLSMEPHSMTWFVIEDAAT
ncbi:MAG: alpha-galactosidase [bacterium]|nr:alpha-galactosidase [bacterium]